MARNNPRPYQMTGDPEQWWMVQIGAHVALILLLSALALCAHGLGLTADIIIDAQFLLDCLWILFPALFLIQAYYVPKYLRYFQGKTRLWKFFSIAWICAAVGLCAYPFWYLFTAEIWAQMMLVFCFGISVLMYAEALLMHMLIKRWLAGKNSTNRLPPPQTGHL
jgi:hypothetical protein